jgi:hypothetical protein
MLLVNNKISGLGVNLPSGQRTMLSVNYTLIDADNTWQNTSDLAVNRIKEITDTTLINQLKMLNHNIHKDGTVRMYGTGQDWLGEPITGTDLENFLEGARYIAKLNAAEAYDNKAKTLFGNESVLEQSTWAQQLSEAQAVIADSNASTPLLTVLASARNISVADYAQNVITASNNYAQAQSSLLAELKTNYQLIDTASTAQALKDTGWI